METKEFLRNISDEGIGEKNLRIDLFLCHVREEKRREDQRFVVHPREETSMCDRNLVPSSKFVGMLLTNSQVSMNNIIDESLSPTSIDINCVLIFVFEEKNVIWDNRRAMIASLTNSNDPHQTIDPFELLKTFVEQNGRRKRQKEFHFNRRSVRRWSMERERCCLSVEWSPRLAIEMTTTLRISWETISSSKKCHPSIFNMDNRLNHRADLRHLNIRSKRIEGQWRNSLTNCRSSLITVKCRSNVRWEMELIWGHWYRSIRLSRRTTMFRHQMKTNKTKPFGQWIGWTNLSLSRFFPFRLTKTNLSMHDDCLISFELNKICQIVHRWNCRSSSRRFPLTTNRSISFDRRKQREGGEKSFVSHSDEGKIRERREFTSVRWIKTTICCRHQSARLSDHPELDHRNGDQRRSIGRKMINRWKETKNRKRILDMKEKSNTDQWNSLCPCQDIVFFTGLITFQTNGDKTRRWMFSMNFVCHWKEQFDVLGQNDDRTMRKNFSLFEDLSIVSSSFDVHFSLVNSSTYSFNVDSIGWTEIWIDDSFLSSSWHRSSIQRRVKQLFHPFFQSNEEEEEEEELSTTSFAVVVLHRTNDWIGGMLTISYQMCSIRWKCVSEHWTMRVKEEEENHRNESEKKNCLISARRGKRSIFSSLSNRRDPQIGNRYRFLRHQFLDLIGTD